MDNEIEDIVVQISEIKNMQLEQLEITKSQVYNIINNGVKNEKIIEHAFDKMLDLAENRAKRHIPMTMEDWSTRIDKFLLADFRCT